MTTATSLLHMMVRLATVVPISVTFLPSVAAAGTPEPRDCFENLQSGSSNEIVCNFPIRPTKAEKADLEKNTRGGLKDAECVVAIKIERATVAAAIEKPNHVFQAPPQPVTCEVVAHVRSVSSYPISATFAPRVVFRDGVAVEASPGLANVDGVTRVVSWPVVTYINRSGMIRDGMLKVVNAWVQHLRARQLAGAR